jgi:hypothetical protein
MSSEVIAMRMVNHCGYRFMWLRGTAWDVADNASVAILQPHVDRNRDARACIQV